MEISLGCLLTLKAKSATEHLFQNYKVASQVSHNSQTYAFAPFGFSGVVSNLQGDNLDAALVFPANAVTRAWAERALQELWTGVVTVVLLDEAGNVMRPLYGYTGSISSGGWDDGQIQLQMNTIVDAVQGSVPGRKMTRQLVGSVPITAAIRV